MRPRPALARCKSRALASEVVLYPAVELVANRAAVTYAWRSFPPEVVPKEAAISTTDRTFPLALWKKQRWGDVDATVRFRPISGEVDASGGIAFRARDGRNFYIVRANSLEDNFRLYTVIDGKRSQIASTGIDPPALGEWHTLRVVAVGPRIQAWLDDRLLIDHRDETFQAGYVGLWTKADAVTEFDDLAVTGGASE